MTFIKLQKNIPAYLRLFYRESDLNNINNIKLITFKAQIENQDNIY